jgi:hypothetical protein
MAPSFFMRHRLDEMPEKGYPLRTFFDASFFAPSAKEARHAAHSPSPVA